MVVVVGVLRPWRTKSWVEKWINVILFFQCYKVFQGNTVTAKTWKLCFSYGLLTILLFKGGISSGTICSISSSLNSSSHAFAPTFLVSVLLPRNFLLRFAALLVMYQLFQNRQPNPSFTSVKIGLMSLNHSGSSVKANRELVFFISNLPSLLF